MRGGLQKAVVRAVVVAITLAAAPPATAAAGFTPGAVGLGDPFFPDAGNGGYDVASYDLELDYAPGSGELSAKATIGATATQDLSAFDLDLRGLKVSAVGVDGADAAFSQEGPKLSVTPAAGIPNGAAFTVVVAYSGRPSNVIDPDGSKDGWIPTDDGAFVASEPQGSPTWFPCNDSLTDKALFDFEITVPKGVEAVANGALVSRDVNGSRATWTYHSSEPMAPYLATSTIGQFRLDRRDIAGIPSVVAVDPRVAEASKTTLRKQGQMLKLWERLFGPYPFSETGVIIDSAPDVGYALETQTRPLFDQAADGVTLAHELAHQWFGDSVSIATWPDMWLNEGFATWAEWRWAENQGRRTTAETFRALKRRPASDPLWAFPPAAIPKPAALFATPVYARGAMALEALRERIGTRAFLGILRAWAADHQFGNADTADFIALADSYSDKPVDGLLQRWLYKPGKP
jgi:aminopeptidase N